MVCSSPSQQHSDAVPHAPSCGDFLNTRSKQHRRVAVGAPTHSAPFGGSAGPGLSSGPQGGTDCHPAQGAAIGTALLWALDVPPFRPPGPASLVWLQDQGVVLGALTGLTASAPRRAGRAPRGPAAPSCVCSCSHPGPQAVTRWSQQSVLVATLPHVETQHQCLRSHPPQRPRAPPVDDEVPV